MDRRRFEELVEEAVVEIPEPFRGHLENVEIVIEDSPSQSLLREMGLDPRRDTLFGLYQGVPLTERGANHAMVLPDRITIFYRPLVRSFSAPSALRREVRRTVIHEIGHFFGLDEEQIRRDGF
jgi:predicted Zn-dependent protease with MMP-like domain